MMLFLYSLLMYLLTPYLLIRLWFKGRKLPAYRKRILERFGFGLKDTSSVDVWLHAVSLGEVIAAIPLVQVMLEKNWSVLITTMTPTGSERVVKHFGDKVKHCYLPYDMPRVVKRFFKQVQPKIGIIIETELWPNLIYQAGIAKVPLILANARLSDSSFKNYLKFKLVFKPILNQFSAILSQSEEDTKRFLELGARKELVHFVGNMKFDLQITDKDGGSFCELKKCWGDERTVVIAASTHENEERQLLAQLGRLQHAIPNLIVLIAPRHPERFQRVYQLAIQAGFNTGLRSNLESISRGNQVLILDCLGELLSFYQMSDYAFVGGSLVPIGGHNVLEPIAMNVPVFSGNHIHNFKEICSDLKKAKAIQLVNSAEELIDAIIKVHADKELQCDMIKNATTILNKNKGSVVKHLRIIEASLRSG